MKTLKIAFALIFLTSLYLQAQHTNTGATITIQSGLDVYADDDFINSSGTVNNSGTLYVTGNFTNNASYGGGTVNLSGGNQTIGGSSVTSFNDLTLTGSGVKSLSANANVQGTLNLGSRELNTQGNDLNITNTSTSAISRTSGFVSSTSGGSLIRNTSSVTSYLFPVGSNLGTSRYRPVEIAPSSSAPNAYSVRLANVDANTEGYSRTVTDGIITSLNSNYFHHIDQTGGSDAANISIFYDSGSESYTGVGHWYSSQWNESGFVNHTAGSPLSSITIFNVSSFSPFILGSSDLASIPTLSEWGLIILTLLTLTMVTLFMQSRQMATSGGYINLSLTDVIRTAPFSKVGYLKILKAMLPLTILGFLSIHIFIGTNGALDFVGTIVSTFIIAYIIYLYLFMRKAS